MYRVKSKAEIAAINASMRSSQNTTSDEQNQLSMRIVKSKLFNGGIVFFILTSSI